MPSRWALLGVAGLTVCAAAAQNFGGGFSTELDGPHAICSRDVPGFDGVSLDVSSWPPGTRCVSHDYATQDPGDTVTDIVPPTSTDWIWLALSSLVIALVLYGLLALGRRSVRQARALLGAPRGSP
jgi:hypothetical protein